MGGGEYVKVKFSSVSAVITASGLNPAFCLDNFVCTPFGQIFSGRDVNHDFRNGSRFVHFHKPVQDMVPDYEIQVRGCLPSSPVFHKYKVYATFSFRQGGSRTTSLACFRDHILLQSL